MKINTIGALLACILYSGCSSNKTLVFGTKTSLGLDVSGTSQMPDHVSLDYSRTEIAYVPPKESMPPKESTNGESTDELGHSVLGSLDSDISFWNGIIIKQTFATGEAAISAASSDIISTNSEASCEDKSQASGQTANNIKTRKKRPLIFTTSTQFGLELKVADAEFRPKATIGYDRSEFTYIPIDDPTKEVRPVYADIEINSMKQKEAPSNIGAESLNFSTTSGVRFKQTFATGKAATLLAKDPKVQTKLFNAMGIKEMVKENINEEKKMVKQIIEAISSDGKIKPAIWNQAIKGTPFDKEKHKLPENAEISSIEFRKTVSDDQYAGALKEFMKNLNLELKNK